MLKSIIEHVSEAVSCNATPAAALASIAIWETDRALQTSPTLDTRFHELFALVLDEWVKHRGPITRGVQPAAASSPEELFLALEAAAKAFHAIAASFGAKRLLSDPRRGTAHVRAGVQEKIRTSEEIERISADAFEMIVRLLAKCGRPGSQVFECSPRGGRS